jgi:MFS family permease
MQWLLNSYGHQTALRVWAVTLFVCTAPLIYFVKPRLPISHASRVKSFDLSFVWNKVFLVYQICNIVEALGFFLPQTYLPSYARMLGASNLTATLTLVLLNVASVFGCIAMGTLTDRYHVTTCILICTIGVVFGTFLIWGFSTSIGPLYVFCIVYGLFAGSFSSTWPGVIRETQKQRRSADLGMVFGFLAAGRGIGNVVSGPLSEVLLRGNPWRMTADFAYGSGYGPLIVFTGITALLGGFSILARPLKMF